MTTMSNISEIELTMSHAGFYIALKNNKKYSFTYLQKRSAKISQWGDDELISTEYHSSKNWLECINTILTKSIHNKHLSKLFFNLITIRKRWKLIMPIISDIWFFAYNNNIPINIACYQNNLSLYSEYYIYNKFIGRHQRKYSNTIYIIIKHNTNILSNLINIICEYLSPELLLYKSLVNIYIPKDQRTQVICNTSLF